MAATEDSRLDPLRRARLEAAIALEPGLERELELISEALGGSARRSFWASLARLSGGGRRVSSAVLEALTEAAREASPPGGGSGGRGVDRWGAGRCPSRAEEER